MNNFFEDLQSYFNTVPRQIVLQDWSQTEVFDSVGISVDAYLLAISPNFQIPDIFITVDSELDTTYKPEEYFGFFNNKSASYNAKGCVFDS